MSRTTVSYEPYRTFYECECGHVRPRYIYLPLGGPTIDAKVYGEPVCPRCGRWKAVAWKVFAGRYKISTTRRWIFFVRTMRDIERVSDNEKEVDNE